MNQTLIKYRAWDKKTLKMLTVDSLHFLLDGSLSVITVWNPTLTDKRVDEVELIRFTGLHDKNGKEIYEGDIIRYEAIKGEKWVDAIIEWKAAGFTLKWQDGMRPHRITEFWYNDDAQTEVIGDIYTTPHLLNSKVETQH